MSSVRAVQARLIDGTKDLNPLETGFIAGVLDGSASFSCTLDKHKKLLHWSVRVAAQDATFIVALRVMTGVGQFIELPKRKINVWSLGVLDGFFLLSRILNHLQIKYRQASLLLKYKEHTLISTIKNHKFYSEEMRRLNALRAFQAQRMDDATFVGYFLGLFEVKAVAILIRNEPLLSLSLPPQLLKQIEQRIGGRINEDAVVWSGWKAFDGIYDLTKNKLFGLQGTMELIKKYELGELKEEELRKAALPKDGRYKKVDVKELTKELDELAKRLKT